MSETHHDEDKLRQRAHDLIDRLPPYELRAAVIALEELEVAVRARQEWADRPETS